MPERIKQSAHNCNFSWKYTNYWNRNLENFSGTGIFADPHSPTSFPICDRSKRFAWTISNGTVRALGDEISINVEKSPVTSKAGMIKPSAQPLQRWKRNNYCKRFWTVISGSGYYCKSDTNHRFQSFNRINTFAGQFPRCCPLSMKFQSPLMKIRQLLLRVMIKPSAPQLQL